MSRLRILLPKLCVVVSLSLGRLPRIVALLDLFHTPPIAHVILTRRRNLAYTEFFTLVDRDGRRAAPIARSSMAVHNPERADDTAPPAPSRRQYNRVRAA